MKQHQLEQALQEIVEDEVPDGFSLWPKIQSQLPREQNQGQLRQTRRARVVWAGVGVVLMLSVMFAASPGALAQVGDAIRKIGNMTFFEREQFPPDLGTGGTAANQRGMTLAEARATVPFAAKIPSWLPQHYESNNQATVSTAPKGCTANCSLWILGIFWRKPLTSADPPSEYAANWISLEIAYPSGVSQRVKSGSVEEVLINRKQTALVHGIWDRPTQQWVTGNMTTLMWTDNATLYQLRAGKGVPLDDLIHVAETIR